MHNFYSERPVIICDSTCNTKYILHKYFDAYKFFTILNRLVFKFKNNNYNRN